MKVLLEVPIRSSGERLTQFSWLKSSGNLFIVEEGKRLRTISTKVDPGRELQSTSLAESKVCTSLSWNKDDSILALVVDRRQIYFWDVRVNRFNQFKPTNRSSNSGNSGGHLRARAKDIDHIKWSNVSDRIAVCYSTGQILLCDCQATITERFVDNSDGVLKQIESIESCGHLDMFLCITTTSEILVMTFTGENRFYLQGGYSNIMGGKFSPRDPYLEGQGDPSVWLAYQSGLDGLSLRKISLGANHQNEFSPSVDILPSTRNQATSRRLVGFHWLNHNQLITCDTDGRITLFHLKLDPLGQQSNGIDLEEQLLLNLLQESESDKNREVRFITCELTRDAASRTLSLAAATSYKIFYFELFEADKGFGFDCEKADDLDLSTSLQKLGLELISVDWCPDGSLLAVRLSNGHILVYRTRLTDHLIATYGPKVAYLSGPTEVTLLNYEPAADETSVSDGNEPQESNAIVLNLDLKPSVLAVGRRHLAVALNNRVRFYSISNEKSPHEELEYVSIVVDLRLSSDFVAVYFDDGRIKLQSIPNHSSSRALDGYSDIFEERFFPDPTNPEKISTFTLTENLFIYCTYELKLNVFSVTSWAMVQICSHSEQVRQPLGHIKANICGNKFICLPLPMPAAKHGNQDNHLAAYLYDLYSNKLIRINNRVNSLCRMMYDIQMKTLDRTFELKRIGTNTLPTNMESTEILQGSKTNPILSAIWDTDGRTVLLLERKYIHVVVVLDNTLFSDEPVVEYVTRLQKASSYSTLYASQGIVSSQTSLGRVVNSILESHDDELKLIKLERAIQRVQSSQQSVDGQLLVLRLKIDYLHSIFPIYPPSRSMEICSHLMSDEQLNFSIPSPDEIPVDQLNAVLCKVLACWSIYTMNLDFAQLILRKNHLTLQAHQVGRLLESSKFEAIDSKATMRSHLLSILDCDELDT